MPSLRPERPHRPRSARAVAPPGAHPTRESGGSNAAFARVVQQRGGVLPDGVVHPAVERAIASQAGRGRPLDAAVAGWAGERLGDALTDVRVHTGRTADALARAVSARAFTVRRDVFFADGEYQPQTARGRRLLGHELAHAVQQRDAPRGGRLRATKPGDRYEREAERAERDAGG